MGQLHLLPYCISRGRSGIVWAFSRHAALSIICDSPSVGGAGQSI